MPLGRVSFPFAPRGDFPDSQSGSNEPGYPLHFVADTQLHSPFCIRSTVRFLLSPLPPLFPFPNVLQTPGMSSFLIPWAATEDYFGKTRLRLQKVTGLSAEGRQSVQYNVIAIESGKNGSASFYSSNELRPGKPDHILINASPLSSANNSRYSSPRPCLEAAPPPRANELVPEFGDPGVLSASCIGKHLRSTSAISCAESWPCATRKRRFTARAGPVRARMCACSRFLDRGERQLRRYVEARPSE
jgi:hypothetical protein